MYFGKLYYSGIFPFLTNKKEIKPRSNIFKIDSVVSIKLSPGIHHLLNYQGEIHPSQKQMMILYYPLCLISKKSTLLVKFGNLKYLSNESSNELLMIGIALVKNSAKFHNFFGTGDSDEPLRSSSFNCLCSPLSKCRTFKTKVPPRRNKYI